jgi:glucose-6-phosphate isomerase
MKRNEQSLQITPAIGMFVYYCTKAKMWAGFYYSRDTFEQIGSEWSASSRDEILIHRPEVNAWHHAVATA